MRPPPSRRGGPGTTPDTAATSKISATTRQHDRDQGIAAGRQNAPVAMGEIPTQRGPGPALPAQLAEWHGPGGRRTLGVWWVRRCVKCGHAHAHRGGPGGGVRGAGCGRGEYRLVGSPAVVR